jgi:hypothetical protein
MHLTPDLVDSEAATPLLPPLLTTIESKKNGPVWSTGLDSKILSQIFTFSPSTPGWQRPHNFRKFEDPVLNCRGGTHPTQPHLVPQKATMRGVTNMEVYF